MQEMHQNSRAKVKMWYHSKHWMILLQLSCIFIKFTECNEFIQDPENTTVFPGENAIFTCMFETSDTGSVGAAGPSVSKDGIPLKGADTEFVLTHVDFNQSAGLYTYFINVSWEANNTEIACVYTDQKFKISYSESAHLTVIGPPLPPDPRTVIITPASLVVAWPKPFSHNLAPISGYQITVYHENGTLKEQLELTEIAQTTVQAFSTDDGNVAEMCETLTFNVTAANNVGMSPPGSTTGGLPIALPDDWGSSPEEFMKVTEVNSEQLLIEITPPHMCPYQDGNYTITFKDEDRQTLMKVGPFLHRYGNGEPFSRTVDPEELEISFVTLMVDSFQRTLPEAMIPFRCCNDTNKTTDPIPTTSPRKTDPEIIYIAIGCSVGVVVLVLLTSIIILIICLSLRGTKNSASTAPQGDKGMVENPIYERYYETIEDCLQGNSNPVYTSVTPYAQTDVVRSPMLLDNNINNGNNTTNCLSVANESKPPRQESVYVDMQSSVRQQNHSSNNNNNNNDGTTAPATCTQATNLNATATRPFPVKVHSITQVHNITLV